MIPRFKMAASADTIGSEIVMKTDEWTVVLPRRAKRRSLLDLKAAELHQGERTPPDVDIVDPERESKLLKNIQACMKMLKSSDFYTAFLDQIQMNLIDSFLRVLGPESRMQMIIYGIGSMKAYDNPRLQLSVALLMKGKFDWVGDIEVFDPVISSTESRVMNSLGCSVIPENEQGKRQALKPTLFFMPHCDLALYDNLLLTNWSPRMLSNVAFGNSFKAYEELASYFKSVSTHLKGRHVLAARKYIEEFEVKIVTDDYFRAFNGSSWHFFTFISEEKLPEPPMASVNLNRDGFFELSFHDKE